MHHANSRSHLLKIIFVLFLFALLVPTTGRPTAVYAANFTVNSTDISIDANPGDGVCDDGAGNCTLYAAIQEANALPGADVINFNIPGAGVQTISFFNMPIPITEPVLIDGYSQPGASPNTLTNGSDAVLLIELRGNGEISDGLILSGSDITVQGLVVNNFNGSQILVSGATNANISGNYIGTDATGLASGSFATGIRVETSSGTVIGGSSPGARNIISGNDEGIALWGGIQRRCRSRCYWYRYPG